MLTPSISAAAVGTERRTHTTLDLDHLYNRGIRLQQSVGNNNWILEQAMELIEMASICTYSTLSDLWWQSIQARC